MVGGGPREIGESLIRRESEREKEMTVVGKDERGMMERKGKDRWKNREEEEREPKQTVR